MGKEPHVARGTQVGHTSAIYCIQCQRKMKMNLYFNAFWLVAVNFKLCFWSVQNLSDDAKVTVDLSGTFI